MASRTSRGILRSLKTRLYSTQTAFKTKDAVNVKPEAKVTRLENGLVVASLENNSPLSRIAVAVNAGSRYEDGENLGVTHCIRSAACLSNQVDSGFGLTRKIQQVGGDLQITGTKEYIIYSTECIRDGINDCLGHLRNMVTKQEFKPWQLKDMQPNMRYDLAVYNSQPQARLFEMIHKAAYRDTLGRYLYAPEYNIGKYDREQLLFHTKSHFTADRMTVVGLGVDHDDLVAEARKFEVDQGPAVNAKAAKYGGGQLRDCTGGDVAFAAIAVEGPSYTNKDVLAAGVLQKLMGCGPSMKYGSNSTSKLGQAVSKISGGSPALSCFSTNYSDGGLFGFIAVMPYEESGAILKAAMNEMGTVTKSAISPSDVQRAKNQLKASIAMSLENSESLLNSMVEQVSNQQQIHSYESIAAQIDKITADDVSNAAKRMFNGKPSMAAIGNLTQMPYLDELYK